MAENKIHRITPEDMKKIPPNVRCKIALETALEVMLNECGSKEEFLYTLASLLGIDREEINPVSEHCQRVFDIGLTKNTCTDFRFIRSWVMCKAWSLIDEQKLRFGDAIRVAWKIAKDICAEEGVIV